MLPPAPPRICVGVVLATAIGILLAQEVFLLTQHPLLFYIATWPWFVFLPLTAMYALGLRREDVGCVRPRWTLRAREVFFIVLGSGALAATFAAMPSMRAYYFARIPPDHVPLLFGLLGAYFVAEEFFFRGFLLFPLHRCCGNIANFVQAIPFTLFHIGKPPVEIAVSFGAALLFGHIALRTRSFLPAAALHWSFAVLTQTLMLLTR